MKRSLGLVASVGLMLASALLLQLGEPALALSSGAMAPAFVAHDLAGEPVTSAELPEGIKIYNFWASWCAPCRAEVPAFNAVNERSRELGVRVYGIALDSGEASDVRQAAAEFNIAFAVLMGDDTLMKAYHVTSLPTTVIVDPQGMVIAQLKGAVSEELLLSYIEGRTPRR